MIKYNLKCDRNHNFEAWFKNSSAFDEQVEKNVVTCAICGSNNVEKALMAPSVPKKGSSRDTTAASVQTNDVQQFETVLKALKELKKNVESNCDYVGTNFAEEARKIHYGETEKRGIYGEASESEKAELIEEGVEIATIPWLPNSDA
ncbi:DUF1178 family protein [Sneathiella glossodoripedis]|uniref:DUF1178 family protein n=1 Tax=Sneathiella glossodoripedis TaxID=418853 RepID=UPI00047049E5|nr:DUF1178 family protein [Sneathiella glossodoripedis]